MFSVQSRTLLCVWILSTVLLGVPLVLNFLCYGSLSMCLFSGFVTSWSVLFLRYFKPNCTKVVLEYLLFIAGTEHFWLVIVSQLIAAHCSEELHALKSRIIKIHILREVGSSPTARAKFCFWFLPLYHLLNSFRVNFFEGIYSSGEMLSSASIRIIAFSGFFLLQTSPKYTCTWILFKFYPLAFVSINHNFGHIRI